MLRKTLLYCARLSFWQMLLASLVLALGLEIITIGFRFGLGMQTTRDTSILATCTCGIRIHHGYLGVLLLPLAWCFPTGLRHALWIIAGGLILSDLGHHFLVLWPCTGSPEFDLVYPHHPYWKRD